MANLFVKNLTQIPQYHKVIIKFDGESTSYQGKNYKLIASYERNYNLLSRIWLAFRSFLLTVFTAGVWLRNVDHREDWKAVFSGKKVGNVYCEQSDEAGVSIVNQVQTTVQKSGQISSSPNKKNDSINKSASGQKIHLTNPGSEWYAELLNDLKFPAPALLSPIQPGSLSNTQPATSSPLNKANAASSVGINLPIKDKVDSSIPELNDLQKVISKLSKKNDDASKKKAALLQQGLDLFEKHQCPFTLETFRLVDPKSFKLDDKQKPDYFKEAFTSSMINIQVTPDFYDYVPTQNAQDEYWADFANASLGGGCFTHGFVQEEIIVKEMPDFAAHLAAHLSPTKEFWSNISTREGALKDRNQVAKGSPNPYLLKGLHRVQAVNNQLAYGDKFSKISKQELLDSTLPLATPQKVNLLAIAAPKLSKKTQDVQWHPLTLQDSFNTLMAGFSLVKEQSTTKPIIHSGKLGAGVFNNDVHAIYLLSRMAAMHASVDLVLHGYSKAESVKFEKSWNTLLPQLEGKSIQDCITTVSQHLHSFV